MTKDKNIGDFFDELYINSGENLKKYYESYRANIIASQIGGPLSNGGFRVKQTGGLVEISKESTEPPGRVIDMKKAFARSPKRNIKKNGGWWMVIPMRRMTSRTKSKDADGMSKRLYDDLRRQKLPKGVKSQTIVSDYLFDNRGAPSQVPNLNYEPKSHNITRIRNTDTMTQRGSRYVAFRTVSDKSHPASWLINRSTEDPDNLSDNAKEILRAVRRFDPE